MITLWESRENSRYFLGCSFSSCCWSKAPFQVVMVYCSLLSTPSLSLPPLLASSPTHIHTAKHMSSFYFSPRLHFVSCSPSFNCPFALLDSFSVARSVPCPLVLVQWAQSGKHPQDTYVYRYWDCETCWDRAWQKCCERPWDHKISIVGYK